MARSTAPAVAPTATTVARASLVNLVARTTSGAALLGTAAVTTNVLDTHGRGIYAILATWIGIGVVVMTSGTTVLAADLIHARHGERMLHGASSAIAVLSALGLVPLGVVISLVSGAALSPLLAAAAVTALLTYCSFEMAIAQARGDVARVSLTDMGMSLLPLGATVATAALFTSTVTTLVAAWAAGSLVAAAVLFALALRKGSLMIRGAWGVGVSIVRRSLSVALSNVTTLLCARIDLLVVAAVLSASAAGVYSIPVALAGGLLLLSRSLLTATYHSIMTAADGEVAARVSGALRHSVIVVAVGGALSVPVVVVAAGPVFGSAYGGIWKPYAILVPASACVCVAEMLRHLLLTRFERQREFLLVATGMLIINGVLAVVGAVQFGLPGAAASTTITYACGAVALVVICARLLSVPVSDLVVPRRSDFAVYGRVVRSLLGRPRSARSSAR